MWGCLLHLQVRHNVLCRLHRMYGSMRVQHLKSAALCDMLKYMRLLTTRCICFAVPRGRRRDINCTAPGWRKGQQSSRGVL